MQISLAKTGDFTQQSLDVSDKFRGRTMNKLILPTNLKIEEMSKKGGIERTNQQEHDAATLPFSGAGFYGVETGALCVGSSALLDARSSTAGR